MCQLYFHQQIKIKHCDHFFDMIFDKNIIGMKGKIIKIPKLLIEILIN